jgi:hypothetical protein
MLPSRRLEITLSGQLQTAMISLGINDSGFFPQLPSDQGLQRSLGRQGVGALEIVVYSSTGNQRGPKALAGSYRYAVDSNGVFYDDNSSIIGLTHWKKSFSFIPFLIYI